MRPLDRHQSLLEIGARCVSVQSILTESPCFIGSLARKAESSCRCIRVVRASRPLSSLQYDADFEFVMQKDIYHFFQNRFDLVDDCSTKVSICQTPL